ncbi:helix-turn-helix domain-containing protein [Anaerobacillus isosaccharinicus]|uniref:Helix-turn-helix domain-containing protein n=1 Tax=Anaerobacillus isosaccharinicus TaxID=1532552 RepID=A0A1S2MAW7_9BACI|nr:helix-turn-helix domain-containing protein [Anaerobacillus isosaccharinicus]MBA5586747.1 helix-turn-helix domain-containing protein [Anaerobacillus isosaccharinicus]QOY35031.1 helix-turn-helix domain-containing protein [Anaerobacillus isosaccharinicus]
MNLKHFSKELAWLRVKNGFSQKELAKGICTQPAISKIENGDVCPQLDTLYLLALKLKVPLGYLINLLLFENKEYIDQTIMYIEELTSRHQYEEAFQLVKAELIVGNQDAWFETYLLWQRLYNGYQLKYYSADECIKGLKKLLENEAVIMERFLDIKILNTIGTIYSNQGKFKESIFYYEKILSNYRQEFITPIIESKNIYMLRVIYNKAKTLYDAGDFELASEAVQKGIQLSVKNQNMSLLGQLYYYQGQCFERLNHSNETIRKSYTQALYFFELLGNYTYVEIIKKLKARFLKVEVEMEI